MTFKLRSTPSHLPGKFRKYLTTVHLYYRDIPPFFILNQFFSTRAFNQILRDNSLLLFSSTVSSFDAVLWSDRKLHLDLKLRSGWKWGYTFVLPKPYQAACIWPVISSPMVTMVCITFSYHYVLFSFYLK